MPIWVSASIMRMNQIDTDAEELRQLAMEVREFVQNKVGTTEFSRVWEGLRKKVVAKRGERRQKGQVMVSRLC
jgi:hypothetical protein